MPMKGRAVRPLLNTKLVPSTDTRFLSYASQTKHSIKQVHSRRQKTQCSLKSGLLSKKFQNLKEKPVIFGNQNKQTIEA